MPPMHDDYLSADPIISQNPASRRGRKPPLTTGFYRIGSGAVASFPTKGPGGVIDLKVSVMEFVGQ